MTSNLASRLRLYLVADPEHVPGDLIEMVRSSLAGGVTAVQLRSKNQTDREALILARQLRSITANAGVLFLVNDRVDLALASQADGVHLGVDDLPLEDARHLLGSGSIIGFSPETVDEAVDAAGRGADYLGVGPVYGTSTKADAGDAIGLAELHRRRILSGLPVIGIGGITSANVRDVMDTGAAGVAVVSAISQSHDPAFAARTLRAAMGSLT